MVKVLIAGDFVPSNRIELKINEGNYDFLDEVKTIIHSVDYAIVNLESPVVSRASNPIIKTGPNLRCSEGALNCLSQVGFKCVTLANNHFRDYGQRGIEDTIESCIKYDVEYVGGGRDNIEANKILYVKIKGVKIAIINICENEWSIASSLSGGSASLDPVRNYHTIKDACESSDYVIVIVHGGIEGYQYPTLRMQETYRFFVDAGANVVINHHQHCFSGYETYKEAPIIYGLGNFCFDKNSDNVLWTHGYLVNVLLDEGGVDFEIIPYVQCANEAKVNFLSGDAEIVFYKQLEEINSVISRKNLLHEQFLNFTNNISLGRLLEFAPVQNKYIKSLQLKKVLPLLLSKKTIRNIYDVINCESHREVILEILNKRINVDETE